MQFLSSYKILRFIYSSIQQVPKSREMKPVHQTDQHKRVLFQDINSELQNSSNLTAQLMMPHP
jgi:hypothetical protein